MTSNINDVWASLQIEETAKRSEYKQRADKIKSNDGISITKLMKEVEKKEKEANKQKVKKITSQVEKHAHKQKVTSVDVSKHEEHETEVKAHKGMNEKWWRCKCVLNQIHFFLMNFIF